MSLANLKATTEYQEAIQATKDQIRGYRQMARNKLVAAQIIKKHEEHAFPSTSQEESIQNYQPQHDSIMGQSIYLPGQQNLQPFYRIDYQFGYPQGKSKIFSRGYGEYYNSQWTLPPACTESGVMLVLPADPGLWSEVISRWESITIKRLNNQTWSDNKAKTCIFLSILFTESFPLMEKLSSLLARLDIESSRSAG
ncbi:hypothetical protein Tco_0712597 [Tanacetum coccineum]